MFTYYPAYDLGISRKLVRKEFPCDLQRSSYRGRKTFFKLCFYELVLREKKKELTGALGRVWRAAAVCTVQQMVERLQNDTRMMEDLGSIQIGKNILNVPYIYDDSDMLQ